MLTRRDIRPDAKTEARTTRADPAFNYFQHTIAELEQRLAHLSEAQRALRISEERYRALYDSNPVMSFTADTDGTVLSVNAYGAQRLGYEPEELIGRSVFDLAFAADRRAVRQAFADCLREAGHVHSGEFRKRRRDGQVVWVRETLRAVQEPGGALVVLLVCEEAGVSHAVESRTREAAVRLELALAGANAAMFNWDIDSGAVHLSERWREMLGDLPRETVTTIRALSDVVHADDIRQFRERVLDAVKGITPALEYEFRARARNGDWRWIITRGKVVERGADGRAVRMIGTNTDVTALRQAEEALRRAEARLRSLTELSSDWYWEQDETLRYTHVTGGMLAQTGFDPRQDIGRTCWELEGVEGGEPHWPDHRRALARRQPFHDFVYKRRNLAGELRYHSLSGQPVYTADGRFSGYCGIGRDVTDRFKAEQRIHRLAHYDSLSGLPNRALFHQRLEQALARARRFGRTLAVLSLDLDRFKSINDSFCHSAGDQVLCEVAERLTRATGATDTVARLSGDEFVVLLESCESAAEVSAFARSVLATLGRPYTVAGQECHLTASMGISLYPQDGGDGLALLRDADTALNRAKEKGKNCFQFYSARMNAQAYERLALESKLRRALEHEEFVLHFQPTVELGSGRIVSVEALARWPQADGSMIEPATFIPVAEDSGLIEVLGQWVLRKACVQAKAWRAAGLPPIRVAVNLSAEDLLAQVAAVIAETGIEPALLEFEITESLMFANPQHAAGLLHALKLMGVRLALDDFGTGYSSLSYLKRFPFDSVKIDRSFVRDLPQDNDDAAITRAVIAMSHSLRMTVTAEGVESAAQLAFLRECGCDAAQGNHFSPALPADRFAALFDRDLRTQPIRLVR